MTQDPQAMMQWQQQMEQAKQQIAQAEEGKKREMFVAMNTIMRAFSDESMKFDIIVDEAPSSPNQQQEVLGKLTLLSQNGVQLPPQAQAVVIENIGLPSTIAEDLAKAVGGNDPEKQQLQQQLQQGAQQLQAVQLENQKLKADKSIEAQKVQIDQMRAQTEQQKAQADILLQTGGVPIDGQVLPHADVIAALSRNVDQLNQAVSAILQAARGPQ